MGVATNGKGLYRGMIMFSVISLPPERDSFFSPFSRFAPFPLFSCFFLFFFCFQLSFPQLHAATYRMRGYVGAKYSLDGRVSLSIGTRCSVE